MRLVEGLRGLKGLKDLKGLKFKVQGYWPRSTMDSIRASEAPDSGSIPDEATKKPITFLSIYFIKEAKNINLQIAYLYFNIFHSSLFF